MEKVNLADKLARFTDHWSPKIVGELNGQLLSGLLVVRVPFRELPVLQRVVHARS
jgi:hypothetical protein